MAKDNIEKSTALIRNLEETQKGSQTLPKDYQWLLDLSIGKKGINERCRTLLDEYYHRYSNHKVVTEDLVQVALSDLWFYDQCAERDQAFKLILAIFSNLLQQYIDTGILDRLMQTLIRFAGKLAEQDNPCMSAINECLELIKNIYQSDPYIVERNSTYIKNHFKVVYEIGEIGESCVSYCREILQGVYARWFELPELEVWYAEKKQLFGSDYSDLIRGMGREYIKSQRDQLIKIDNWEELSKLAFFGDIAQKYRSMITKFNTSQEKIYYILYLFKLEDMYQMRKSLLMDLNRIMRKVGEEIQAKEMKKFTVEIFGLFKELKDKYRETVLDSTLSLGKTILGLKDHDLTHKFIDLVIELGFVSPQGMKIDKEWQVVIDSNHIKNIRIWLQLVELDPIRMNRLLSALIVNLRIGGIFVSDTDLFQKDISWFLNGKVQAIFKQVKQLARLFPIYYNKIGAEGELRELTTAIDEIGRRQDRLMHFFRKQVHTESNNTNVNLACNILIYWETGAIAPMESALPADVLKFLDTSSEYYIHNHELVELLSNEYDCDVIGLTKLNQRKLEQSIEEHTQIPKIYRKKVFYLIRIYNILVEKYSFGITDLNKTLSRSHFFNKAEIDDLLHLLNSNKNEEALGKLFLMMKKLMGVIFAEGKTEAREDIYYKRHVAAGIPSMYGEYSEPRFDALGLIFRLEKIAKILLEEIEASVDLKYLTHKTLKRVYRLLRLYETGLEMDGISNPGFSSNLEMFHYSLESSFTLDQYQNLVQFLAENTKEIVKEYFYRIYEQPLKEITHQYIDTEDKEEILKQSDKLSEQFYRDLLTSAFIIQKLDNFIMTLLKSIRDVVQDYEKHHLPLLMSYEPDQIVSPLYLLTPELDNPIFLGSKAYFLKVMLSKGFPIPPGFVLSTELFRHRPLVLRPGVLRDDILFKIRKQVSRLQKLTGRIYGEPSNPLLLSVRSGTAISMPGAMNTFLNVGMNDEIAEEMSKQENMGWTAWDSYRRLLQSWGMAQQIKRDEFDDIIQGYKEEFGIEMKQNLSKDQMKTIAKAYKQKILDCGKKFIDDPYEQLTGAIGYVLDSWDSKRALVYREQMQIANEWGTAVVVQQMVLGNMSENSGTGVLFTHDPSSNQPGLKLYGEYTVCSQGEDIVAGLVNVLPLTSNQAKIAGNDGSESLEAKLPLIYNRLNELAAQMIYEHGFSHQEIEFTFESDQPEGLYILQTRNQDIQTKQDFEIFSQKREEMEFAGSGIGIGGGALNGILAFDDEDLQKYREQYPDKAMILVRPDTVPDDIGMIFKCDGLITGRGGATSHAAVTAVRLGIVCIVNCKQLEVDEDNKCCKINDKKLRSGDEVAIDGHFGSIFVGNYDVHTERMAYQG
ncbi:MAG: PEP/pyruvate-binding domain-containing protein [Candidatus Stygibacter australis]|nr:PEP/pyruvate-binding domain-containing protein [Candidatus Stygibacter australis]MDP8321195.1 PEP/pyruvate-binding domain-containing protein [Candidatus Stygibacter australis]